MFYAVIHDNRLLGLYSKRDDAKEAALKAATEGADCADFAYRYEPASKEHGERWEVEYRTDRRRRLASTGYYIAAANLTE